MPTDPHARSSASSFPFPHLLICAIGLSGGLFSLGEMLARHWANVTNSTLSYTYTAWAKATLATTKPTELAGYLFGATGLFLYFLALLLVHRKKFFPLTNTRKDSYYLAALGVTNLGLLAAFMVNQTPSFWAGLSLLWLMLLFASFRAPITTPIPSCSEWRKTHVLISTTCLLLVTLAVSPYLGFSPLKISNDFLWVPETTLTDKGPVDNTTYIMQHGIGGLFDSRRMNANNTLQFLQHAHLSVPSCSTPLKTWLSSEPQKFLYRCLDAHNALLFKSRQDMETRLIQFCKLASPQNCQAIRIPPGTPRLYHHEERDFIDKNRAELQNSFITGHYFHHQYAMLGPINESVLAKETKKINFFYGFGAAKLFSALLGHLPHSVTFENYIAFSYLLYP